MLDHLIISTTTYVSFKDLGLMEELESSVKYVPTYQLIEKIRKEEKTIQKEALKKVEEKYQTKFEKHMISAINNLMKKDITIQEIAIILNLREKEIEKIIGKK